MGLPRCLRCRRRAHVHPEEACPTWDGPLESRYHSREALVQSSGAAARLLRPEFIIDWYNNQKKPLPKRQDLPPEAFLDLSPNTRVSIGELQVIAVSYCWLSKEHPDPDRYHLETLVQLLKLFCNSSYENAKEMWPLGSMSLSKEGLRGRGVCFGGRNCARVGVFLDWTALYQDKPEGTRTSEQTVLFRQALKSINIWYAHSHTIVWCLEGVPEGCQRAPYQDSGWTVFEQSVAGILSPSDRLLCLDAAARERLLAGKTQDGAPLRHYLDVVVECRGTRGVPLTPERFGKLICNKTFTDGSDRDSVVLPKYSETFRAVITDALSFQLRGLSLDDRQVCELIELTVSHCRSLTELDLSCNDILLPMQLGPGLASMKMLRHLNLSGSGRSTGVPFDLAPLAQLSQLQHLELAGAHVCGSVEQFAALQDLEVLWLTGTKVCGDVSALATLGFLRRLGLGATYVSGDITPLSRLTMLERLGLHDTTTFGDVAELHRLKHLERLGLGRTRVFGDVALLESLWSLQELDLSRTTVSGDVARLAVLPNIKVIELRGTAVHGDVARLAQVRSLEHLDLSFTNASGDASLLAWLPYFHTCDFRGTKVSKGWERLARKGSLEDSDALC